MLRAEIDQVLLGRLGGLLSQVGMLGEEGVEWQGGLSDAIGWALRLLGYETASVTDVTDADLAGVTKQHMDALIDLSELRTLETINQNFTRVTAWAGPVKEDWSSMGERLRRMVADKRQYVSTVHAKYLPAPLDGTGSKITRIVNLG